MSTSLEIPAKTSVEAIGPYRLEERIGAGGMGEVFRAYDTRLGRRVAVKHLPALRAKDETAVRRFRREARLAAGLNHPAIVHLYDLIHGEEGDEWIVMELVDGRSVAQMVREGALETELVLRIALQTAEALVEAHAHEIIHRDLKTENVMVARTGHVKVLDFGLAKQLSASPGEGVTADSLGSSLTAEGAVMGTYRAMSPEQARGFEVDERTDLFSLGVLIYEAASGQRPFLADSAMTSLTRICTYEPEPLVEHVPAELSLLVERLMRKTPAERPRSAAEVVEKLRGIEAAYEPTGNPRRSGDAPRLDLLEQATVGQTTVDRSALPAEEASAPSQTPERIDRLQHRRPSDLFGVGALMVLLAFAAFLGFRARQEANIARTQADELAAFLLDDLHPRLQTAGRLDDLDAAGRKALEYFEASDSSDPRRIARHAEALRQLGDIRMAQGEFDEALAFFQRSVSRTQALVEGDPGDRRALFELGQGRFWVGNVHYEKGDFQAALAEMRAYLDISKQLAALDPTSDDLLIEVADGHNNVGALLVAVGNPALAKEHYVAAVEISSELVARNPSDRYLQRQLVDAHLRSGQMLEGEGELESAQRSYVEAVEAALPAYESNPQDTELAEALALAYDYKAGTALYLGDVAIALAERRRQLAILEELWRVDPDQVEWGDVLASARYKTALVLTWCGDCEQSPRPLLEEAIEWHQGIVDRGVQRSWDGERLGKIGVGWAEFHLRQGDLRAAGERAREVLTIEDRAWREEFDAQWILGKASQAAGNQEEARRWFAASLEMINTKKGTQESSRNHKILSREARALLALNDLDAARVPVYKLLGMKYSHPRFQEIYAAAAERLVQPAVDQNRTN